MDVRQLLESARETLTVKRVFGEPYERNGVTVIPVARLQGGAGGGQGDAPDGNTGSGGGFGLSARPAGVYVVAGERVRWEPALDINRIVLGAQIAAIVVMVTVRGIIKARLKAQQRS